MVDRANKDLNYLRAKSSADVVIGAHDGQVSSVAHRSLEEGVDHTLSSGDVLLIIGGVKGKAFPFVLVGLLFFFDCLCYNLEAPR